MAFWEIMDWGKEQSLEKLLICTLNKVSQAQVTEVIFYKYFWNAKYFLCELITCPFLLSLKHVKAIIIKQCISKICRNNWHQEIEKNKLQCFFCGSLSSGHQAWDFNKEKSLFKLETQEHFDYDMLYLVLLSSICFPVESKYKEHHDYINQG